MTPLVPALRAELRRVASTRLWWALLVPVALQALLVNLSGGLLGDSGGERRLLLAPIAFTLTLTVVFAAVHGAVAAAGEFRHRTVSTTYVTAGGRGRVLAAKVVAAGSVGALYAAVAVLLSVAAGLALQSSGRPPEVGALAALTAVGVVVAALWGAIGAALGMLLANQVGALVALLVYLQVGELVLSALLNNTGLNDNSGLNDADSPVLARLTAYLPGNAGDVAIYDAPADALAGPTFGDRVVEELAGVTSPPPWWGALAVLAGWATLAVVAAWVVGDRRDVT